MIGGPVMTVSKADMLLAAVVTIVVMVMIVRDSVRSRRVRESWKQAAKVMIRYPDLLARGGSDGEVGVRRRDGAGMMTPAEALSLLVAALQVRSDEVRAVQVGDWWVLEKIPEIAPDQRK